MGPLGSGGRERPGWAGRAVILSPTALARGVARAQYGGMAGTGARPRGARGIAVAVVAGAVTLFLAAAPGLGQPGIPSGPARTATSLGAATAPAAVPATRALPFDLDGDGHVELVVGAPGEGLGSVAEAGAVTVLPGTPAGPSALGSTSWHQDSPGVTGGAEAGDWFGDCLASGDFDADGHADLAVGVPGEDIGGDLDTGAVHVLYGGPSGLTASGGQMWHQDSAGVPGAGESGDRFGDSLAVGDLDGDGFDDLVIGVPGEAIGTIAHAGAVVVLRGSADGVTSAGARGISQDTAGVADAAELPAVGFEEFGAALATGDVDGDGRDDLVVGVPGEDGGSAAGAVHVLPGAATGVTTSGSRLFTARSLGGGWSADHGPGFGAAVATADLDGNGRADLAIGDPTGAASDGGPPVGTVLTARADADGGFDPADADLWHLGRADVPGTAASGDAFGARLASGDLTGDGIDDVAVAAPTRAVGQVADAGAVLLLVGTASGPVASSTVVTQAAGSVPGSPELGDRFGGSLAVLPGGATAAGWLAVGASEGIGAATASGSVTVLPGSPSGPDVSAAVAIHQDGAGVPGAAEAFDRFAVVDGVGARPGWLPAVLRGRVVTVLPTTRPVVALTFDCGSSDAGVRSILATLDSAGILATFFVTGDFARRYPSEVRAMATAGHRIGNHSDTHPHLNTMSSTSVAAQVDLAEAAIRPLAGEPTLPWFRFPYGEYVPRTLAVANAQGYAAIGWTVDTLGWKGTSGGQSAESVRTRVLGAARPGEIVLMHVGANPDDGTTLDAAALPSVISGLRARGYGFVTLDAAAG